MAPSRLIRGLNGLDSKRPDDLTSIPWQGGKWSSWWAHWQLRICHFLYIRSAI